MDARIVLFGATGYTGRRTAEAMVARGLRPVLAGRDQDRLAGLARQLGGLETVQADVTRRRSVAALVGRGDVLVSTVGPFTKLGEPAVVAAIEAGAIYFDSTGEPPFIRTVHERHGPAAAQTGAALLTSFASDYLPGVLAGALALRDAGAAADRVDVGYFVTGRGKGLPVSRGTLRSVAAILTEPVYSWRDARLRTEPAGARLRTFDVDGTPRPAVTVGALEQFALPRLAPGLRTVDVYLGWFGPASGAVHAGARVAPLLERVPAVRRAVNSLAGALASRAPEAPSPSALAEARSYIVAEVFDATGTLIARTRLRTPDPYSVTADLLAWGADRAAARGVHGVGALDPVAAFGLDELAAGAAEARIAGAGLTPPSP